MSKKYDLAVKVGSYTDKEGKNKHEWMNVGVVMTHSDGGQYILLNKTFNPAGVPDERGGHSIIISMFEPKGQGQSSNNAPQQQQAPVIDDIEDSIPF